MIKHNKIASTTDSSYWDMDENVCCNTMFIISYMKNIDIDILKESLRYVVKTIPILSCKLKKGFWRDKWVPIEEFNVEQMIEKIRVEKDLFFDNAYNKFLQLTNKKINLQHDPLLKIKLFYNEEVNKKVLVFCMNHILVDGRGANTLLELIGCYYDSILNNKEIVLKTNTRKFSSLLLSLNITNIFSLLNFKVIFEHKSKENFVQLIPINKQNNEDLGICIEKIRVSADDLNILKSSYSKYDFTVNDIILHFTLKLLEKYNIPLEKKSDAVAIALGVDLRRYLKKDLMCIANYAGTEILKVRMEDINNMKVVSDKFHKLRKQSIGLGFLIQPMMQALFPISIQKRMLRFIQNFLIKWSVRSIQTTNVGKIDEYVRPFNDMIEDISFIGPSPYYGFPLISVSGYKDTLTIYLTKYNDFDNISFKVKEDLEEIICNALKNSFILNYSR